MSHQYLLLLIGISLLSAVQAADMCASLQPTRSARWDRYIESLEPATNRARRSSNEDICEWTNVESSTCTASGSESKFSMYDSRGRRRERTRTLAPPENQGKCGNCWAFATIGALYDQLTFSGTGRSISRFSAEHLTTCLTDSMAVENGNGCCGSLTLNAGIDYIRTNGIAPYTCKPYSLSNYVYGSDSTRRSPLTCPAQCKSEARASDHMVMRFEKLNSEREIKQALDDDHFVIAGMEVTDQFISAYKCGVYTESRLSYLWRVSPFGRSEKHAVEIVDYGTCNEMNFWVVKNSWGSSKHERGYFRIRRGGIYTESSLIYNDLDIANKAIKIVIGPSDTPTQTPTQSNSVPFVSCSAGQVSRPQGDEMVMSAAEFVLQTINVQNIKCPNGGAVTSIATDEVTVSSASVQSVSGSVVNLEMRVNLKGCTNSNARLEISGAMVYINPDNTFSLINCGNRAVSGSTSVSITSFVVVVLMILGIVATP